LYQYLKHAKRRRKRGNYKTTREIIPNRSGIERPPKILEKRKGFGDIEVGLIMGSKHKLALLVMVDRTTLKVSIDKMKSKNADAIAKKIIHRMKKEPDRKTMTFDNDLAFS